jgi:hypothetical protein
VTGTRQEHLDLIHRYIEGGCNFKQILRGLKFHFGVTEQSYIHELVTRVLQGTATVNPPGKPVDKPAAPKAKTATVTAPKLKVVNEYDVGFIVGHPWNAPRLPRKVTVDDIRKALASPYLN